MLAFFERTVYKKHPMADGTVHLNIIFRGAILAVIAKVQNMLLASLRSIHLTVLSGEQLLEDFFAPTFKY